MVDLDRPLETDRGRRQGSQPQAASYSWMSPAEEIAAAKICRRFTESRRSVAPEGPKYSIRGSEPIIWDPQRCRAQTRAVASRNNVRVSRRLLDDAAGYVVYGSDGRRLGTVIELVTAGEERADFVAIRCDGIFLWRRRVVPVAAVAGIDPKKRTVTLLLDGADIKQGHELWAQELREGWVANQIARYASAPIAEAEAPTADVDAASESPPPNGGRARASEASADGLPLVDTEPVEGEASGLHVLFVPTVAGYVLIERDDVPPRCGATLELSDPPGSFVVVKLAQSPLPNDQRRCAYLDRLD